MRRQKPVYCFAVTTSMSRSHHASTLHSKLPFGVCRRPLVHLLLFLATPLHSTETP